MYASVRYWKDTKVIWCTCIWRTALEAVNDVDCITCYSLCVSGGCGQWVVLVRDFALYLPDSHFQDGDSPQQKWNRWKGLVPSDKEQMIKNFTLLKNLQPSNLVYKSIPVSNISWLVSPKSTNIILLSCLALFWLPGGQSSFILSACSINNKVTVSPLVVKKWTQKWQPFPLLQKWLTQSNGKTQISLYVKEI